MKSIKGKTALVTGASSGIGEATALRLLEQGATVYAAARRMDRMEALKNKGAHLIAMDVTNEDSMVKGVNSILEKEGSVDILINNAGYGSYGAIEDVPVEEGRRQFEVNIFGLARLTQLVLPGMRDKHYGKIVNISSIGGKMYTPFGGWYHATKHALEGFTDCLRLEVQPFGVDAIIIEPGGIATDWGTIAADNLKETSLKGVYKDKATETAENMTKMYTGGKLSGPDVIAKTILKSLTANRPKTRYAAGSWSRFSLTMRKVLSDRMFDRIVQFMI
jgi:NAD(P)-dependent dehydrogenase (short-subunit alcohol dehydrogenase family)